ncbi:hypothetical protein F5882DRAFT_384090 [Hyaloscypha sp. PMI_1271]|nr:hypothetical protein F5882DRAFT_384090 [Hyaloscypha sp. PMI_1271]
MHALKSVIVGALATTVSATYKNGQALRREVFQVRATASGATVKRPFPTATASTNSSNVCDSVLDGLATVLTELPTPTGDLYSYLTAATTLTDPCHLSVPSSIGPAFSTYESAVISFYSAHKSQLNSAVSACPNLTILVENPVCSTAASSSNKTIPPVTPIPTPTEPVRGTATSTPRTSVISTGSTGSANEMREKSAVAVFAVGVVGVVAMLL